LRKEYELDFAEAVTSSEDSELRQSYRDGLIFLGCFVLGVHFVWGIILLILKLKGTSVGCAAGYAFGLHGPSRNINEHGSNNENDQIWENNIDQATTHNNEMETTTQHVLLSETISKDEGIAVDQTGREETYVNEKDYDSHPWRREIATQLCFLCLCMVTLICTFMVFRYTLKPLVDTIHNSKVVVYESKDIVNETDTSLSALVSARNESQRLIDTLRLDYEILCPNYTAEEIVGTLGVDLRAILDFLSGNFSIVTAESSGNITDVSSGLMDIERLVLDFGKSFETFRRYIWILPAVLFPLISVITLVMNGAFLSMKRQSSQIFQNFLSRWTLPTLIVLSSICFALATMLAIGAAVGTDACTSGSESGSPYDTISHIINTTSVSESWRGYALDVASGCHGSGKIYYIVKLRREIQRIQNFIWNSLSQVDSVGQQNLIDYCGADHRLVELLNASRNLTKILYSAQRAIKKANETLLCENTFPIYDTAVNELICKDTVGALAWGFVLFFTIGVASMGIISLRASWSYKVAEDKIFDDSEVAENVILDEHEEYLHYISAYKHEWEEYRGVNRIPEVQQNHEDGSTDSSSSTEPEEANRFPTTLGIASGDTSTVNHADTVTENPSIEVVDGLDQAFNPYSTSDSQSLSTSASVDNISFLSLNASKEGEKQVDSGRTVVFNLPPSLLQENTDQERDDYNDHFFLNDEDGSLDECREQASTMSSAVEIPKSQGQVIRTKYIMVPSAAKRPNTEIEPVGKIRNRLSISKILDELEEISTSKLAIT
jgi:hypothetical protein